MGTRYAKDTVLKAFKLKQVSQVFAFLFANAGLVIFTVDMLGRSTWLTTLVLALDSLVIALTAFYWFSGWNSDVLAHKREFIHTLHLHCDSLAEELRRLRPVRKRTKDEKLNDELRLAQEKLYRDVEFGLAPDTRKPSASVNSSEVIQPILNLTIQLRLLALNARNESVKLGHPGNGFGQVAQRAVLLSEMTETAAKMLDRQINMNDANGSERNHSDYFSGIVQGISDLDDSSLAVMGESLKSLDADDAVKKDESLVAREGHDLDAEYRTEHGSEHRSEHASEHGSEHRVVNVDRCEEILAAIRDATDVFAGPVVDASGHHESLI